LTNVVSYSRPCEQVNGDQLLQLLKLNFCVAL